MKLTRLSTVLLAATSISSFASPWINTNESELKHSIDMLVSAGLINRPVNQYPLLWQGLIQDLDKIEQKQVAHNAQFALTHLRHALTQAKRARYSSVTAYYDDEATLQDGFGERQAAKSGISTYGIMTGKHVSAKVQVNYADEALDGKQINHYGSHLAILLGNWSFSAERLNYWWGPANENALLLSNNAAPMTAARISRANSNYDGPSWLSFIGPWQITALAAKQKPSLNDKRDGDFWGIRLSSTPVRGLELALSATASDFVLELPLNAELPTAKQRVAGIDVKYSSLIGGQPISVYAEIAGNNDHGILPAKTTYTMGIEHFMGDADYRLKSYLELSDNTTNCQALEVNFQCNFQASEGGSQYTERDQWLGAAIGPQAKSLTLASDYYQTGGYGGFAKLKLIDFEALNIERKLLELGYQQGLFSGLLKAGVFVWRDTNSNEDEQTQSAAKLSWEYQF
ncbi:capsule assembly Wzi family protein [Pseudoalteromonas sp. MMG022]|uniref:capsule assembly Wzi family protein n=1 Tax=Pseudoalteromonas sp. MMG022 TaxID=2909978 RepID=UPI001F396AA9|nr:capsule assembly Wzi family protein [Pseudoalteromonas sp. MMG022]MCF6435547.1 capsule assembly Wzi family protein [Pseudoalteromonas sp. MMG022]